LLILHVAKLFPLIWKQPTGQLSFKCIISSGLNFEDFVHTKEN